MIGPSLGRLRGGSLGQLAGLISTVGIQLAQVPIYLAVLGAEVYGSYLIIIAIPTLLTLSDLGLALASGTAMIRLLAGGDREGARRVSRYAATVLVGLAAVAAAAVLAISTLLPHTAPGIAPVDGTLIFLGYSAYALLGVASSLLEATARAAGDHARTWTILAALRLCDFLVAVVILVSTQNLWLSVAGMVLSRIVGLLLLRRRVVRIAPWASFRPTRPDPALARELARPMVATFVQPVAYLSMMQGAVLIVGAQLGPVAVVALAATRTLVNAIRQLANIFVNAGYPGLTRDLAMGERDAARRLWFTVAGSVLAAAIIAGLGIILLGPAVLAAWTHGAVEETSAVLAVFVLHLVLDLASAVLAMPLLARNEHFRISLVLAVAAAAFLVALAVIPLTTIAQVPLLQSGVAIAVIVAVLVDYRREGALVSTRPSPSRPRGPSATGSPRPS